MNNTVLSCSGIHKSFRQYIVPSMMLQERLINTGRKREFWSIDVLKNVSLSVSSGEWVGIYGKNGAGKTTLMRILAGLLPADRGTVQRAGALSCFFELGAGFHPERSATENIYLHGLLHGLSVTDIERSIDDIIDYAGVQTHRDLPLKCYSTGMAMRLAFAAATNIQSDIYLFDEILAVGDEEFRARCKERLLDLKERGATVVMVNHDLNALKHYCDRIVFLEEGVIANEVTNREASAV